MTNYFDLIDILDDDFDDLDDSFIDRLLLGFSTRPDFWDQLDDDTAAELQTHLHICFPQERI